MFGIDEGEMKCLLKLLSSSGLKVVAERLLSLVADGM